ncbi:MAG: esterase [Gammaproteobacteria bacterium]|nr:MAG: esterase [Gammaproteobacteria bacterium]
MFSKLISVQLLFTLFLFTFPCATASELTTTANKMPIITSHTYQHHSTIFQGKRRYMVSLPENYYASDRHYPSLFVIDGDFQFQHTSALVTNLARMGKIPPMIVIGVANQGQNDYLYTTTWPIDKKAKDSSDYGGAKQFSHYLNSELLPIIDHDFRTNSQKALAGYSLGALFTSFEMMQKNTAFNAFLAMSPSAWFDDYALPKKLSNYINTSKNPLPDFFISVANEEEMGVDKTVAALKQTIKNSQKKALKNWHWQFKHYPNESHFSTAMPALYDGLTFLSPNFYFDPQDMMKLKDYQQVLAQFKLKKNNWAGFQFEWVQTYKFAQYIFWSKQTDKVDELLTEIKKEFPASLMQVSIQLAKGFVIKKQPKKALALLNKVKAHGKNNALWHHQMSLALKALNKNSQAEQHQQKTMALAKQQHLSSWLIWELSD